MPNTIGSSVDFRFPIDDGFLDPEGEVQVPLASQEIADETHALLQQAADGVKHPRE